MWVTVSLSLSPQSDANDDYSDWLGAPEQGGQMNLSLGVYEDDASTTAINLTLPLVKYSELYMYYSDYQSDEIWSPGDSQEYGFFWNSDPYAKYMFGFGYDIGGQSSDLKSKDYSLAFEFSINHRWRVSSVLIKGDAELSIDGFSPVFQREFEALGLDHIERHGGGFGFRYDNEDVMWRFSYRRYDYDDNSDGGSADIDAFIQTLREESLGSARFAVEFDLLVRYEYLLSTGLSEAAAQTATYLYYLSQREQINREIDRWVNDYVGYHLGNGQKNVLSNQEFSLDYVRNFEAWSWSVGLFSYESYIDEKFESQYYSAINFQLSKSYSLGVLLSYMDESSQYYGELTVGASW